MYNLFKAKLQEPAFDIPSYYIQTSTSRKSNTQHFILPTVTPFTTRPATSSEQLQNGTSYHHQCIIVSKNEPQL